MQYLRIIFCLATSQFIFKHPKCSIAQTEVFYLGHVISASRAFVDKTKIGAMLHWPKPTAIKALQELLGLTGYNCKFVKVCSTIVAPLNPCFGQNLSIGQKKH